MKTFVFSLSPQRVALSTAATLGLATLACPLQALAQSATSSITQVSVNVAPISISGERLGGYVNANGSGLTAGAPPTVTATGSLATGTGMTAGAGTTFNFNVTARSGDQVATAGALGTGLVPTSQFGSQTGSYSGAGTSAALTISDTNAATVAAGSTQGVTATALFSTTMQTGANTAEVRRVGTSANQQATFTTERQGALFQNGGSGLTDVTGGGFAAATALGADPTITAATGGTTQAGVDFTLTQQARTGQAAAAITASSTNVTQPGYGTFTNTLGGTTAGTITPTNINTMTVNAGAQGTTSTLSVIQSLTAF